MSSARGMVPVPGSERQPLPDARAVGPADPNARIQVTVRLRHRPSSGGQSAVREMATRLTQEGRHLSRAEYEETYGADPSDIAKVEAFAREKGLQVVESSSARRTVAVSGTVAALSAAFGVELQNYEHPGGNYRGRTGPVHVPADLGPVVEGVFGLDDRAAAKPHLRRGDELRGVIGPRAGGRPFTPVEVARLYNFPGELDGSGQCIGIIELGGGFRAEDIEVYFSGLSLPSPEVVAVSVDGGPNSPSNPSSADGEVMLDIEVAGAVAPRARIAVYFAPNTDAGFLDAVTTAIHDSDNNPSVLSISWGAPETGVSPDDHWTQQAMRNMDAAFQAAAVMGVTVCCASGDNGSTDGIRDGSNHVDFPASSPFVLACGGTRLEADGAGIGREVVWNDGFFGGASGGGVSAEFARPDFQSAAGVPASESPRGGRGVPDVAGDASPATGYRVRVDGQNAVIGGTSAVAPLWAGLVALINQSLGRPVGFLNPLLYSLAGTNALRDIDTGNNGGFPAGPGWDACTGLGSPDGARLLDAIRR
jgi:kumamolisin